MYILLIFQLLGAYSVSKTALLGLTKAVAQDLASEKIRVNCVAPGVVRTKFARAVSIETIYQHYEAFLFEQLILIFSCTNRKRQTKRYLQQSPWED